MPEPSLIEQLRAWEIISLIREDGWYDAKIISPSGYFEGVIHCRKATRQEVREEAERLIVQIINGARVSEQS